MIIRLFQRSCRPALLIALGLLAGCASEGDRKLPGVYRVDVQQGNIIEQEMIDKLRPGMDRNQVRFILGTPAITDPFHADRWDYVFTLSKSGKRRQQRHLIVHFKDDKLAWVDGDVQIGERKAPDEAAARTSTVDVPLDRNKPGVFSRMFNALPFVGDDDKPRPKADDEEDAADDAPPSGAGTPAGEEDQATGDESGSGNTDAPTP